MARATDDNDPELGDADVDSGDHPVSPMRVRLDRALAGVRSAGRGSASSSGSTKRKIEGLDARERRYSLIGAFAAFAFGIAVYLEETNDHHFRLAKGQLTPQTTLVLGIVFGVLLAVATLVGRRALIGFTALFAFLAFGTSDFVLGLPFLVLAGWLLYRSYTVQREASAELRSSRAAGSSTAPPVKRGAGPSPKSAPRRDRAASPALSRGQQALHPEATAALSAQALPTGPEGSPGVGLSVRPVGPTRTASLRLAGDEGRTQKLEDLVPPADQRPGRRLLAQGPNHLHLGDHPYHRGINGQQQQPGLVPPHVTGVHLRLEELGSSTNEGIQRNHQSAGGRGTQSAHLPHQSQQLRPPGGQAEH